YGAAGNSRTDEDIPEYRTQSFVISDKSRAIAVAKDLFLSFLKKITFPLVHSFLAFVYNSKHLKNRYHWINNGYIIYLSSLATINLARWKNRHYLTSSIRMKVRS